MNFETIKCFICSTDFKTNRTFTLVSLGKERLWFCNRHIPKKKTLQHLSDAEALGDVIGPPPVLKGLRRHDFPETPRHTKR